jgi:hypothetical protein
MTTFGPTPREQSFVQGLERFRENAFVEPRLYWLPDSGEWKSVSVVTDVGLESVGNSYVSSPSELYSEVQSSWNRVRAKHPKAVWDPFSSKWFDTSASGPGGSRKPDWLKSMREELARVETAYQAGAMTPEERDRQRQEILDRYF